MWKCFQDHMREDTGSVSERIFGSRQRDKVFWRSLGQQYDEKFL